MWHSRVWGHEYTEAELQPPNIQTSSLTSLYMTCLSCLSGGARHLSCHFYLVAHSISPVIFIWWCTASLLSCSRV
jgi:hypothetical protein